MTSSPRWRSLTAGLSVALILAPLTAAQNFQPAPRTDPRAPAYAPADLPPGFGGPDKAPFRRLDTIMGPYVNMNHVPIRPVALTADTNFLAAVNTHANTVRVFDVSNPDPTQWQLLKSLRTAWGPVSVAWWQNPACQLELLVVCRSSDALVWLTSNGRVQGFLGLPAEPGDLLVDQASDTAWVSCAAAGVVVEVDLGAKRIVRKHTVPSVQPTFLSWEGSNVLVAPLLSGNNTTVEPGGEFFLAGPNGVLDLTAAPQGLPDEDLFRIVPGLRGVQPVVQAAGSVQFAHRLNPVTGALWMLGTDAHNAQLQSEPECRGVFSENRLALVAALPAVGAPPVPPTSLGNLDDSVPGTPQVEYVPTRTVGQPYALAFDSTGQGFVTGMLTDNVTQLSSAGAFVREWDVGSIPRGLLVVPKPTGMGPTDFLTVYCWGSNKLEVYDPSVGTGLVATLNLGPDPNPQDVIDGRTLYYSAAHSQFNNQSCNTCHVDGFSDMLAWDLSDRRKDAFGQHTVPVDDKGPMITQTLRNIRPQHPYHWRGERADLADFNGAFDALLGGAPLSTGPGGDFEKFQAFVFSLRERANPHESPRRVVSDAFVPASFPVGTSAVRGQTLFFQKNSLGPLSCQDCHALPTGTSNDIFRDEGSAPNLFRSHLDVPSLDSLWRKHQPTRELVELTPGVFETLPTLGGAMMNTGRANDVRDLLLTAGFDVNPLEAADIGAFLLQLDGGFPPQVHEGVRVGYGDPCGGGTVQAPGSPLAAGHGALLGGAPSAAVKAPTSLSTDVAQEFEQNLDQLQLLLADASSQFQSAAIDLVLVAELAGQNVTGVLDPVAEAFHLEDEAALNVGSLSPADLVNAYAAEELVGMLFALPLGHGIEYQELDPDDGGAPAVVPGPGASSGTRGTRAEDPRPDQGGGGKPGGGGERRGVAVGQSASFGAPTIRDIRVAWVTARVAKIVFFTDQPTRTVTYYTPEGGGATQTATEDRLLRAHMVLLRHLEPGTAYDVDVAATNDRDESVVVTLPEPIETRDFLNPVHVVVSSLATQTPTINMGGSLQFQVDFEIRHKTGEPAVNHVPAVDVLIHHLSDDYWSVDQTGIMAPGTDTSGATSVTVLVPGGLKTGDEVFVKVTDVASPSTTTYVWSMPDTAPANRMVFETYTGP